MEKPTLDVSKKTKKKHHSHTMATRLDVPEPSSKLKKKWKPIVDLVISVLTVSPTKLGRGNQVVPIRVTMPYPYQLPPKFPKPYNKNIRGDKIDCFFNCEKVLVWLYERKLSDYTPNMVYEERRSLLNNWTRQMNDMLIECDDLDILNEKQGVSIWDKLGSEEVKKSV